MIGLRKKLERCSKEPKKPRSQLCNDRNSYYLLTCLLACSHKPSRDLRANRDSIAHISPPSLPLCSSFSLLPLRALLQVLARPALRCITLTSSFLKASAIARWYRAPVQNAAYPATGELFLYLRVYRCTALSFCSSQSPDAGVSRSLAVTKMF